MKKLKHIKLFEEFDDFEYVDDDENIPGNTIDLEQINQRDEHFDRIRKSKESKHEIAKHNLEKYGTVTLYGHPYIFTSCDVKPGKRKEKMWYNIDISVVGLSEYESGYSGTASVGILVKVDPNGNILNIDTELNENDLNTLKDFISNEAPEITLNENSFLDLFESKNAKLKEIMMYKAYLKQGNGCDYTIACGETVVNLKATNMDDAKKEMEQLLDEEYHGDMSLESCEIFEVNEAVSMDLKAFYSDRTAKIKDKREADTKAERLRQYEIFKKEFENK